MTHKNLITIVLDKSGSMSSKRGATIKALKMLGKDDALLIAGKGHEDYQIIQGVKHHYSDQEVVREFLHCA